MPNFAANLSTLFTELPFLERFGAAYTAGFRAVEFQAPYDFAAEEIAACAKAAGVEIVLFNAPMGNAKAGERGFGAQPGREADLEAFEQSQSELLGLLARFKTLILSTAVRRDPLTQLPLRYGIEHDFALYQKEARRNRTLLYVVIIDVDHFKPINDTYGHPVGDRVLRHLADTLKRSLRDDEPLYRYGGEEFLWLLKCKSATEARQSARRVLAIVGTTPVPIDNNEVLRLTVTLGLAQAGEREDLANVIERADQALYEGKSNGRNRYVIAES